MKKFLIYICILFITVCCNKVYALECSQSDRERLQKLASNISYVLEEYEVSGKTYFKITFTGVSKEFMIISSDYDVYSGSGIEYETVISNLNYGKTYIFTVKSLVNCFNTTFRNITINLPKYNQYYNDKICDNAREYRLCQKWFNGDNVSYDEFVNNVNAYINDKKTNTEINNDYIINNDFDFDFGRFYRFVYFPSLFVTILLILLLIFVWNKEKKKNRL